MILHATNPCATCPFRVELQGGFDPETLDETIGENLRGERYVHRCHQTLGQAKENLCVGFLRFIRDNGIPNRLAAIGQQLGIIDYAVISDAVDIHLDWDALLDNHAQFIERCVVI